MDCGGSGGLSGGGLAYQAYADQPAETSAEAGESAISPETANPQATAANEAHAEEVQAQPVAEVSAEAAAEDGANIADGLAEREGSEAEKNDTSTALKEEPEIESEREVLPYDVSPESIPPGKRLLPDSLIDSDGLIMTHRGIGTRDYGSGLDQWATYFTQSDRQYVANQHSGSPEETAEFFRQIPSLYKEPTLNLTVGGQEAIAVDGEFRRVVYFRIGNETLLVSSWDDSVEELAAVAEQIAAQP